MGLKSDALSIRLPRDDEWTALAGGLEDEGRYLWDAPSSPEKSTEERVLARGANVREAGLEGTSPVGMYPLGASRPFGRTCT